MAQQRTSRKATGSISKFGMMNGLAALCLASGAACAITAGGNSFNPGPYSADANGHQYYPGRLLVRTDLADARIAEALPQIPGVKGVDHEYPLVPGLVLVNVEEGAECALRDELRTLPGVVSVDLSFIRGTLAQATPYGITNVNAPLAWPLARGLNATIAVLDTGFDFGHTDLPVPVLSASFVPGQAVTDLHGHGTHCSGIALARDNTEGVVGVAPLANLMAGKVLGNSGYGDDAGVLDGVNWAVANGADVISMSLGGGGYSAAFEAGAQAAFDANVVVVAAAGNSSSSEPSYPAAYPAVISVSAVDSSNNLAGFSNFGSTIDIAAPGVNTNSTYPQITISARWNSVNRAAGAISGAEVYSVTGNAIFCGTGLSSGDFPPSVNGQIAHIRRGGGTFRDKAFNAYNAGAVGVIISNNSGGLFGGTLNDYLPIPVIGISQTDGDQLQTSSGVSTSISFTPTGHNYANLSGTSMACPHVAGVAALAFDAGGGRASALLVRQALQSTATDLGDAGRDDLFGDGLVNAQAAVNYILANLPCPADFDGSGGTPDSGDIDAFFVAWLSGDASADVDLSGGTPDAGDISIFFTYWLAGGC
jgi:serine protease